MEITKDRKGSCYIIDHVRSGYHESIFVTSEELRELVDKVKELGI